MNPASDLETVFPLSAGSPPRPTLRPPRLPALVKATPGPDLDLRALARAWAARRSRLANAVADCQSALGSG